MVNKTEKPYLLSQARSSQLLVPWWHDPWRSCHSSAHILNYMASLLTPGSSFHITLSHVPCLVLHLLYLALAWCLGSRKLLAVNSSTVKCKEHGINT